MYLWDRNPLHKMGLTPPVHAGPHPCSVCPRARCHIWIIQLQDWRKCVFVQKYCWCTFYYPHSLPFTGVFLILLHPFWAHEKRFQGLSLLRSQFLKQWESVMSNDVHKCFVLQRVLLQLFIPLITLNCWLLPYGPVMTKQSSRYIEKLT